LNGFASKLPVFFKNVPTFDRFVWFLLVGLTSTITDF